MNDYDSLVYRLQHKPRQFFDGLRERASTAIENPQQTLHLIKDVVHDMPQFEIYYAILGYSFVSACKEQALQRKHKSSLTSLEDLQAVIGASLALDNRLTKSAKEHGKKKQFIAKYRKLALKSSQVIPPLTSYLWEHHDDIAELHSVPDVWRQYKSHFDLLKYLGRSPTGSKEQRKIVIKCIEYLPTMSMEDDTPQDVEDVNKCYDLCMQTALEAYKANDSKKTADKYQQVVESCFDWYNSTKNQAGMDSLIDAINDAHWMVKMAPNP